MTDDYPLYVKWRYIVEYFIDICSKYPKNVRFTLCDRIVKISLDVLEAIIEVIYAKQKTDILNGANLYMEKLRALMQISVNKKYISLSQYEHISREINEAGKMLGGWIKSCGAQAMYGKVFCNLLSWKNSGFSIDNSVQILTDKARVNLSEYISRAPVSLKKLRYEPFKGRVLFHTQYNQYFGENVHMFEGCDFLAELTQHIPPKGTQYIRRYGLYASRTRGKWPEHPEVVRHAPEGWKAGQKTLPLEDEVPEEAECDISEKASRKTWARLIAKIYEIDPFVCPKCGSEMRVIAVIQNTAEIKRILKHLMKVERPPPGVDYSNLVN